MANTENEKTPAGAPSALNVGLGDFGYGYAVVDSSGRIVKAVALGSQEKISLLVRTRNGAGGVEQYSGLAGNFWVWCKDRGLQCATVKLQGAPNAIAHGRPE